MAVSEHGVWVRSKRAELALAGARRAGVRGSVRAAGRALTRVDSCPAWIAPFLEVGPRYDVTDSGHDRALHACAGHALERMFRVPGA